MGRRQGTVDVVGLGTMGGAFAKHLVAAGWRVLGYDIDAGRRRAAARAGVEIAPNVSSLAKTAPVIVITARSRRTGRNRRRDHQGQAAGKDHRRNQHLQDRDKKRAEQALRKAGHVMLDCPVSGTGAQAAVKDIVIYAGLRKCLSK